MNTSPVIEALIASKEALLIARLGIEVFIALILFLLWKHHKKSNPDENEAKSGNGLFWLGCFYLTLLIPSCITLNRYNNDIRTHSDIYSVSSVSDPSLVNDAAAFSANGFNQFRETKILHPFDRTSNSSFIENSVNTLFSILNTGILLFALSFFDSIGKVKNRFIKALKPVASIDNPSKWKEVVLLISAIVFGSSLILYGINNPSLGFAPQLLDSLFSVVASIGLGAALYYSFNDRGNIPLTIVSMTVVGVITSIQVLNFLVAILPGVKNWVFQYQGFVHALNIWSFTFLGMIFMALAFTWVFENAEKMAIKMIGEENPVPQAFKFVITKGGYDYKEEDSKKKGMPEVLKVFPGTKANVSISMNGKDFVDLGLDGNSEVQKMALLLLALKTQKGESLKEEEWEYYSETPFRQHKFDINRRAKKALGIEKEDSLLLVMSAGRGKGFMLAVDKQNIQILENGKTSA
jgi:hypothetical protein